MNSYLLVALAERYGAHEGITHWAVSYRVARKGDLFARLRGDHSCTIRTYNRTLRWFSDHWPVDLEWPADIPRPDPSPDSPAAQAAAEARSISVSTPETEIGDPLAAVEAALERQGAAMDREPPDWDAAHAAGAEAVVAGSVLGDDGQIACPEALCRAVNVPRSVYQRVLAQYADGGPRERDWPRRLAPSDLGFPRRTASEAMLRALVKAGDARFRSRVEQERETAELTASLGSLGTSAT